MPELPEVESGRRLVEKHCAGNKVLKIEALEDEKVIEGCTNKDLEASLLNATLIQVHRRGKHLWFETDRKPLPLFHFGMTGAFIVRGQGAVEYKREKDIHTWPPRFTKVLMEFSNGAELAFTDPRRFAKIRLRDDPLGSAPISELGPDPVHAMPPLEEFDYMLQRRKAPVKAVLLDQAFMAGIGNWIADEVLYQSQVHPSTIGADLNTQQVETIWKKISEVITFACEAGARYTEFPDSWLFHYRWGKVAGKVDGNPIEFLTVGGRTTAVVPAVQQKICFKAKKVKQVKESPKKKTKSAEEKEGVVDLTESSKSAKGNAAAASPKSKSKIVTKRKQTEGEGDETALPKTKRSSAKITSSLKVKKETDQAEGAVEPERKKKRRSASDSLTTTKEDTKPKRSSTQIDCHQNTTAVAPLRRSGRSAAAKLNK